MAFMLFSVAQHPSSLGQLKLKPVHRFFSHNKKFQLGYAVNETIHRNNQPHLNGMGMPPQQKTPCAAAPTGIPAWGAPSRSI